MNLKPESFPAAVSANICSAGTEHLRISPLSAAANGQTNVSASELAAGLLAAFRAHGHVCNILTHVSGGNWGEVERTLLLILDPSTSRADLTPLAENVLDLLLAENGVAGRVAAPYFQQTLLRLLPRNAAGRIWTHVASLLAGGLFPDDAALSWLCGESGPRPKVQAGQRPLCPQRRSARAAPTGGPAPVLPA